MAYRQPKKFNVVTAFMLLAACAAGYWMWIFFPFYWDAWTVDHQLREAAAQCYKINVQTEPSRSIELRKLLKKVQADSIRLAHITDPDFDVALEIDGTNLFLNADYKVEVRHPVGHIVTIVKMHRTQKADIKRVQWD